MIDDPRLDLHLVASAVEYAYGQGWSDGLPVVPATRELTDEFLRHTSRPAHEVIGGLDHLRSEVTVEVAAVNAVMAGCRPEHFPVVLAAWDALMLERATREHAWQSTSGPAPLIVVNGPARHRLGFNCGGSVMGPGNRANATVARAIGLIVRNGLGVRPEVFERASQGLPGRWSLCIAENEEESPWEPLCVEGGLAPAADAVSTTLVRTTEYVDNRHTDDPEKLLNDFADTLSRSGPMVSRHSSAGIIFCPRHARLLARAGMSKSDVRTWLFERSGRSRGDLFRVGKNGVGESGMRVDHPRADPFCFDRTFAADSPRDLLIAVAGPRIGGASVVARTYGTWSQISARVEPPCNQVEEDEGDVIMGRIPAEVLGGRNREEQR